MGRSRFGIALLITILSFTLGSTVADAQVTPLNDEIEQEAPGLGNIIGSPDAGPDPTDPGDRGGWAQLVLAVILFGGIAFILRKVFRLAGSATTE